MMKLEYSADAQESPIGRYRLLSESDIETVYAHDPHNNSLVQAWASKQPNSVR